VMGTNHVAFNALGQGKHKFLQMPEQASAPITTADEGGFYTKVAGETQLFFRGEGNGFEYQLTKAIQASSTLFGVNTIAYVANNDGGWTFLPGGLLLQYGKRTTPGSSGTITFPVAFPSGTAPFSILTVLIANSGNLVVTVKSSPAPSATSFDYDCSSGSGGIYWQAIGK
jgi:hypothetical protein